mgnify:CR=1 FL=1|tara:strand:+ start:1879 stop:2274 length:396 start_codon:yes stop_codon:yes gene_type:complete
MKDRIDVSSNSKISMPIANLIMVIALVASTVFGYSSLTNRITALETNDTLMESDLLKKAEQTPKNLEIFMLLEELFKQTDKQQLSIDQNIHTQIKLDHLEEQLSKALRDIEKLKDKVRENGNSYSSNNVSQ